MRGPRLLGSPLALHDVRDVEAHIRVLLDSQLAAWGARLGGGEYEDALTYLLTKAWELSGLDDQGEQRWVWVIYGTAVDDDGEREDVQVGPFNTLEIATRQLARLQEEHEFEQPTIRKERPAGSYDPAKGISFSTFSRRILTARIVDWYRSTFGDSRYGGRLRALSLDQLVDEWENKNDGTGAADGYLDRNGPGARLDAVDELNRHAYHDPHEEVLTRVALDR